MGARAGGSRREKIPGSASPIPARWDLSHPGHPKVSPSPSGAPPAPPEPFPALKAQRRGLSRFIPPPHSRGTRSRWDEGLEPGRARTKRSGCQSCGHSGASTSSRRDTAPGAATGTGSESGKNSPPENSPGRGAPGVFFHDTGRAGAGGWAEGREPAGNPKNAAVWGEDGWERAALALFLLGGRNPEPPGSRCSSQTTFQPKAGTGRLQRGSEELRGELQAGISGIF